MIVWSAVYDENCGKNSNLNLNLRIKLLIT